MNFLKSHPVAVIVIAQLFGTSLWFSPNSAAPDLIRSWHLTAVGLGQLTSAVQIGFILGTLLLATTGLADRFAASRIFALASVLGAGFNAVFALLATGLDQAIVLRFAIGLCLAGIYPLGMKMVIAWTKGQAGSTLGLLVAMPLVLPPKHQRRACRWCRAVLAGRGAKREWAGFGGWPAGFFAW